MSAAIVPAPLESDDAVRDALPHRPLAMARGPVFLGLATIAVFILGLGVWSAMAPLKNAAIAAGTVVSASHRKTVEHLEGGILDAILVRDGDRVRAGQVLVRLDATRARATLAALQNQLWDVRAREARLVAERDRADEIRFPADLAAQSANDTLGQAIAGQQHIFAARRALEGSKIAAIGDRIAQIREEIGGYQAELGAFEKRIALEQEQIAATRPLVAQGLERKPQLLTLERELAEMMGRRGDTIAQIAKAKATIAEAEIDILNERNANQKQIADDLRDTQNRRHDLEERIDAAADVLARTEVKAPEDGVVTDLKIHTPGGVIKPGEPLLDIVPGEDQLIVEAQVRPEDISRVRPSLPAQVRLLPYQQRRTPPIGARVAYVSADRLMDERGNRPYYAVRLLVDAAELAKMPDMRMIPGMPCEAMIETGETTVALYALSPLLDRIDKAFREE